MGALYLAFRLRSIRGARFDRQAIVPSKLKQISIVAMTSFVVSVSLYHDCLGIVAQNVLRDAAEEFERTLKACHQCFGSLVIREFNERISRVREFRRERAERQ